MTVTVESAITDAYIPNGVTTAFGFDFKIASTAEVQVVDDNFDEVSSSLYSVTIAGDGEGGTVTFTTAPDVATYPKLYILSVPNMKQLFALQNDNFNVDSMNSALDRGSIRDLWLKLQSDRSLKAPMDETPPTVEALADRSSKVAWWSAVGKLASISMAALATAITPSLLTTLPSTFKGDPGSAGEGYATIAALALAGNSASEADDAYLTEADREGKWIYTETDISTYVTNDPEQGVYVAKQSDSTGASGGWVRVHNGVVHAKAFGFGKSGNTSAENRIALQAVADFVTAKYIAGEGIWPVHIAGTLGTITIDKGIQWFDHDGSNFTLLGFYIEGVPGYQTGKYPIIEVEDDELAAFYFQNTRGVYVRKIGFKGQIPATPTTAEVVLEATPWHDPSGNISDEQYAPHAGIAWDAFSIDGTTANHYPGMSDFYTQNVGSNTGYVEDCTFIGFSVGIAQNTSFAAPQGDGMVSNRNRFFNCKVTHAFGNSQSRACSINDIFVNHCHTMVDCTNYGQGIGNFPEINGGQCTIAKQVFVADGARNAGQINGLYLEEVWRLGKWSGNIFPLSINSIQGKFMTPSVHSVPGPDAILEAGGPVKFFGGSLYINDAKKHDMSIFTTTLVSFYGTSLNGYMMGGEAANADGKFAFSNCPLKAHTSGASYGLSDNVGPCRVGIMSSESIAHKGSQFTRRDLVVGNEHQEWESCGTPILTLDSSVTITVGSNGEATFTSGDGAKYREDEYVQTSTGWTMETYLRSGTGETVPTGRYLNIGRVKSVVGNAVTLEHVPKGMATGTYNVSLAHPGYWRGRCIVTTSSDKNVTFSDAVFNVGDRIRSAGIPSGAYIDTIAGDRLSGTITHTATTSAEEECKTADIFLKKARKIQSGGAADLALRTWFRGDAFEVMGDATTITNGMIPYKFLCKVSGNPSTTPAGSVVETYLSENNPAT